MPLRNMKNYKKRVELKFHRLAENLKFFSTPKVIKRLEMMPDFPSSACTADQYLEITLSGAATTYGLLLDTAEVDYLPVISIDDFTTATDPQFKEEIARLLTDHGSDKAEHHNYHQIYALFLEKMLGSNAKILEIGLGTNNTDIPSNMGFYGTPGASLRAWKEVDPMFEIIGADIDERVLFNEPRISTFQLDQTSDASWTKFLSKLGESKFDLIIDDGLHSPTANLSSIKHLLPRLTKEGVFIVEDIAERALPVWNLYFNLAPEHLKIELVKTRRSYILIIRNK
jgi:hypothetical protein